MPDNFNFGLNLNHYKRTEEISIRHELHEFISGEDFGEQKNSPFVHRKLRRDKYGERERCTCWRQLENEASPGCPYCDGLGYYWDETIIPGFMSVLNKRMLASVMEYEMPISRNTSFLMSFITTPEVDLKTKDVIYFPHVDDEGTILHPVRMDEEYIVLQEIDRRLDWNSKEFSWAILRKV